MNKVQQFAAEAADAYLCIKGNERHYSLLSLPARQLMDKVWTEAAAGVLGVAYQNLRQPQQWGWIQQLLHSNGYRVGDEHPRPNL